VLQSRCAKKKKGFRSLDFNYRNIVGPQGEFQKRIARADWARAQKSENGSRGLSTSGNKSADGPDEADRGRHLSDLYRKRFEENQVGGGNEDTLKDRYELLSAQTSVFRPQAAQGKTKKSRTNHRPD